MYRTVEFQSTLAGEWQFDAHGSPVVPGGRELAEAIAGQFARRGERVTPVEQHETSGGHSTCGTTAADSRTC
jgi:hypothetical protein